MKGKSSDCLYLKQFYIVLEILQLFGWGWEAIYSERGGKYHYNVINNDDPQ